MQAETREFKMHENLLMDVIKRQAGTVDKAVLEGVMNLIEADATNGRVTIKSDRIIITDDGRGFQTRDEIIAAFEMFGKSAERKEVAGRWATFQMGRGQLFAFGKTTYRTRTFEMVVDIRMKGLQYDLRENMPDSPGCIVTVELYDSLDEFTIQNTVKAIKANVKYVSESIFVNGVQVNVPPSSQRWTMETDEAYIRVNEASTNVEIYNLGVLVQRKFLGVGGTVVSKKQLQVNFARNETLDSCPVWKGIRKYFRAKAEKTLLEKKTFTTDEVGEIIASFRSGQYKGYDVSGLKLCKGANKKRYALRELGQYRQIAYDSRDSAKADSAMKQQQCVVLDKDFMVAALSMDGASEQQLTAAIFSLACDVAQYKVKFPDFVPLDELYVNIKDDVSYVAESKLTKQERIALDMISRTYNLNTLTRIFDGTCHPRKIVVGMSDSANSWGDGKEFIAFNRDQFQRDIRTHGGWTNIVLTLCEQYTHSLTTASTSLDIVRGDDYNDRYYNAVRPFLAPLSGLYRTYVSKLIKEGCSVVQEGKRDALALDSMADGIAAGDEETLTFPKQFLDDQPDEQAEGNAE